MIIPGPASWFAFTWSIALDTCPVLEVELWKYVEIYCLNNVEAHCHSKGPNKADVWHADSMWAQWSQISGIASPVSCRVISLNRKVNHTRRSWKHALPTSQTVHRPVVYQHAHKMRLGTRTNQGLTKGEMTTKKDWLTFAFLQQVKSSEKCPANPSKCTKFPQEFLSKQKMIWKCYLYYLRRDQDFCLCWDELGEGCSLHLKLFLACPDRYRHHYLHDTIAFDAHIYGSGMNEVGTTGDGWTVHRWQNAMLSWCLVEICWNHLARQILNEQCQVGQLSITHW